MEGGDLGQLIVAGIIIVATILGPLVERIMKKRAARPPREARPARREPMLPYEDLVEDAFGPYIQRRKEAYEARQRELAAETVEILEEEDEEEEEVEPAPPPRRPVPEMRILEELPARPARRLVAGPAAPRRGVSLEERIFRNRRLSPGAKLVLAREILDRPRR